MRRKVIPTVVATVLASTGLLAMRIPAASAAPACTVAWTTNAWSTGFTAEVAVTNGGAAVPSWTLSWTFGGDQRVTSGWNATVTQTGATVTAASNSWNGALATGATARFGFQATASGALAPPTAFRFNGVSCSGDVDPTPSPTTPTPTTPTPSPTVSTPPPSTDGVESFENQTGATPSGDWSVATPDCGGTGTAAIDRTVAHSGTTSLRIDGKAGYCNHVFARNTKLMAGTANVWHVRYWVRHTTALPGAHTTAVAMRDAADGDKDLRFGGQNNAMQFNRASDDATLPEQSPAGVAQSRPLPVNTWNCVEFTVDGRDGTIATWLNGTAVPGLAADGVPTHDIDGQWLNRTWRPRLTDLKLGWESYGDGADTLWYDDVVVSSTRTGC